MAKYNINNYVTIYPTVKGFKYMYDLLDKNDVFKSVWEVEDYINSHTTEDGGFREQLWVVMNRFGDMFFNGSQYLENTDIELTH